MIKRLNGTRMNADGRRFYSGKRRKDKRLNGTQMNTDEHRFYICQKPKDKRHIGTRMNEDKKISVERGAES